MTRLAHGAVQVERTLVRDRDIVARPTALTVAAWLGCAWLGTCTLGVVALERAAKPARAELAFEPGVALVSTSADGLAAWEQSAREAGLEIERVSPADLAVLPPERHRVWLVLEPAALGDAEWAVLDGFALRGGGIVFAARAVALEPDAAAREAAALRRLFPGHRFEFRSAPAGALSTRGGAPIAAGLSAEPSALADAGAHLATSTGGALVWGADPASGAALAGRYRGAPAVWVGCPLEWVLQRERAARLAANALRYAAREPLVDVVAVPEEARAIRSEQSEPGEGVLRVNARNAGSRAASNVVLRVYLPVGALRPSLEGGRWFARRPLVRYASGHTWMELVLRELDPGESVEYTLLF